MLSTKNVYLGKKLFTGPLCSHASSHTRADVTLGSTAWAPKPAGLRAPASGATTSADTVEAQVALPSSSTRMGAQERAHELSQRMLRGVIPLPAPLHCDWRDGTGQGCVCELFLPLVSLFSSLLTPTPQPAARPGHPQARSSSLGGHRAGAQWSAQC